MKITQEHAEDSRDQGISGYLPCPVCSNFLELRESKNRKPYCICFECGIQIFIRGKAGIEKLRVLLEHSKQEGVDPKLSTLGLSKSGYAMRILRKMAEINHKIEEVKESQGFADVFLGNRDKETALKILRNELSDLSDELSELYASSESS